MIVERIQPCALREAVTIHHPRRLTPAQRTTVSEIVRLLLPANPPLGETERARVESAVTGFVASQIEALPGFLAVPYRVAIGAFALLPALRFGHRFARLDDPAKAAWLALWSDGPVGPMRDFTKLIRSCALLAYFDHPDVRLRLPHPGAAAGSAR